MADFFIPDAVFTTAKASSMAGLAALGAYHLFSGANRKPLALVFLAGLVAAVGVSWPVFFLPPGHSGREFLTRLINHEFVLLYLVAVLSIRHASGSPVFPGGNRLFFPGWAAGILVFLGSLLCFAPHSAAAFLFLKELALLYESPGRVTASALTGFAIVAGGALGLRKRLLGPKLTAFVWVPQFFLLVCLLVLVFGGTRGVAEYSLIPAVQSLVMKFVHDLVHHTFTILLVPDHPLLRTTTWNFIGFFFGPNFGISVALLILLLPPLMFLFRLYRSPAEGIDGWWTRAERRLHLAEVRKERHRQSLIVAGFVISVLLVWFVKGSERAVELYVPSPKPVVEDKGLVIIPLADPTMDLRDGRIHTFSFTSSGGDVIRILVVSRSDRTLAVCLDACEICPPDGYGQKEKTVVCRYCATPIPTDTLGKPGGCNPIPLKAEVSSTDIRIRVEELQHKWRDVNAGKGREAVAR